MLNKTVRLLLSSLLLAGCQGQPHAAQGDQQTLVPSIAPHNSSQLIGGASRAEKAADNDDGAYSLRPSLDACIEKSEGITPQMQACIESEFDFQDARLQAAYQTLLRAHGKANQKSVAQSQTQWLATKEKECVWDADTEGQAQRLEANYCDLRATARRANELEKIVDSISFPTAAVEATRGHGELVRVESSSAQIPVAVVIRYTGDARADSAGCTVQIVEDISGRAVVVAANPRLLMCAHISTHEGLMDSIKAEVSAPTRIVLTEQFVRGGSSFVVERNADGKWYLSEAEFRRPESNPETGDMEAVTEVAKFPAMSRHILFSNYKYELIEKNLVKTITE